MTKKPKPASAKGWCVCRHDAIVFVPNIIGRQTKLKAIKAFKEFWTQPYLPWRSFTKMGYRVVRFTATEV